MIKVNKSRVEEFWAGIREEAENISQIVQNTTRKVADCFGFARQKKTESDDEEGGEFALDSRKIIGGPSIQYCDEDRMSIDSDATDSDQTLENEFSPQLTKDAAVQTDDVPFLPLLVLNSSNRSYIDELRIVTPPTSTRSLAEYTTPRTAHRDLERFDNKVCRVNVSSIETLPGDKDFMRDPEKNNLEVQYALLAEAAEEVSTRDAKIQESDNEIGSNQSSIPSRPTKGLKRSSRVNATTTEQRISTRTNQSIANYVERMKKCRTRK